MTRRRVARPILPGPTPAGLAALLAVAVLGVACTGSSGGGHASSAEPSSSSSYAPASSSGTTPTGSGSVALSPTIARGTHTAPTVALSPATTLPAVPIASPAEFGTGLSARIAKITYGSSTGSGRGSLTGQATVALTLVLQNSSRGKVDVNAVQVAASYGVGATPAIPSYGDGARNFAGSLSAGRSTSAVYLFLIPTADQHDVDVTVWYRSGAPTVLFHGPVRQ